MVSHHVELKQDLNLKSKLQYLLETLNIDIFPIHWALMYSRETLLFLVGDHHIQAVCGSRGWSHADAAVCVLSHYSFHQTQVAYSDSSAAAHFLCPAWVYEYIWFCVSVCESVCMFCLGCNWFLHLSALSVHVCLSSRQLWPLWPRFNAIRCRVHSAWDVKQENYCAESWSADDLKQHQAGFREIRLLVKWNRRTCSRGKWQKLGLQLIRLNTLVM